MFLFIPNGIKNFIYKKKKNQCETVTVTERVRVEY
jgi:hypothetical protein